MEQRFEQHLQELRKRFLYSLGFFSLAMVFSFYFSSDMLAWVQNDLGFALNALTAYETFYTQLMIAGITAFFLSLPFIAYHGLLFVKPGLSEQEYYAVRNYLPFSVVLFAVGAAFGYEVVVKYSLNFFAQVADTSGVESIWGLKSTLGFAFKIAAFSGLIFQLPVVSFVLGKAGLINRELMREYRPYFIVSVLLASAFATPPDIITQLMVTVPVLGLYQVSIYLVGLSEK
ncbi:twin-arginine translocase subunit TatC [Candidatus Nanohalococcus occultus]|uniref:twin-arginine translocase subunit TatC n=1 Tax=Candidatus Nanohalococcus occultus TaxID=2978047 RepID=UPI0039E1E04B